MLNISVGDVWQLAAEISSNLERLTNEIGIDKIQGDYKEKRSQRKGSNRTVGQSSFDLGEEGDSPAMGTLKGQMNQLVK